MPATSAFQGVCGVGCFQGTKGKSRRLFLLNALAIYLHSVAYSDPTKDYYACEIIFWAGSLMMPLGYMPFSLRGSRLYLLYMRGKLMVAESRIALGLPSDLKYRRLHAYVVDHSRWILKWWAPYLIIGSYLLVTLVACIATYVNNGSQCSETAYAWITFAQAVVFIGVGLPTLIGIWMASVTDVFSIRNELTVLYFSHIPVMVLTLLSFFAVVPISGGFWQLGGFVICLFNSMIVPVLQSYKFEYTRAQASVISTKRKPSVTTTTAATSLSPSSSDSDSSSDDHRDSNVNPSRFRSMPVWRRIFLRAIGVRFDAVQGHAFRDSPEHGSSHEMATTVLSLTSSHTDGAEATIVDLTGVSTGTAPRQAIKQKSGHRSRKTIYLSDLLRDPTESERLTTLALQSFSAELILFLQDVIKYQEVVAIRSVPDQIARAATIIDAYVVDNSPRQINIVSETRTVLIQEFTTFKKLNEQGGFIADEHFESLKHLFGAAEAEVKALVRTNILPLWKPAVLPLLSEG